MASLPRLLLLGWPCMLAASAHAQGPLLFDTHHTPTPNGSSWSVELGDLDGDGLLDAVSTEATTPGTLSVHLGLGDTLFSPGTTHPVGDRPQSCALADLDGDGQLDAFVVNEDSDDLSLLLGDGAGGFAPEQRIALNGAPRGFAIADFDLSGTTDFVVGRAVGVYELCFYSGTGGGGFAPPTCQAGLFGLSQDIEVASMNADALPDLVGADGTGGVFALLGNGDGTFTQGGHAPTPGMSAIWVGAGDWDGDGLDDAIAVGGLFGSGAVAVILGDGTGQLGPADITPGAAGPTHGLLADLDADGRLDALSVDHTAHSLSWFRGDGASGVEERIVIQGGSTAEWAAAGDLEGDGDLDLVSALRNPGTLMVVRASGPGVFAGEATAGSFNYSTAAHADLNGDGALDLVSTDFEQGPSLRLGDQTGAFGPPGPAGALGGGVIHSDLQLADLNNDGQADAIALGSNAHLTRWLNDGAGGFAAGAQFPLDLSPDDLELGDLDGDGFLDAVATCYFTSGPFGGTTQQSLAVLYGQSNTAFVGLQLLPANLFGNDSQLELADLTGDGALDAVIAAGFLGGLRVRVNDGAGNLSAGDLVLDPSISAVDVQAADVNADGATDLLSIGNLLGNPPSVAGGLHFIAGDGTGGWAPTAFTELSIAVGRLELGDVTGDGHLDAVVRGSQYTTTELLLGDGTGGYAPTHLYNARSLTRFHDVDADGRLDLTWRGAKGHVTQFNRRAIPTQLTHYGTGTPGCAGLQALTAASAPLLGASEFGFHMTGAPHSGLGTVFFGTAPSVAGFPLLDLQVHIDLAGSSFLKDVPMFADGEGGAFAPLPIPDNASLSGQAIAAQALWPWASQASCDPSLLSLSSSAGLSFVLQP